MTWTNGKDAVVRAFDGNLVSLGYSCTVKRFLVDECGVSTVQYPIDFIGSSAWALRPLFENLGNPNTMPLTLVRMQTEHTEGPLWVWKEFYLRVLHHFDTGSEEEVVAFRKNLKRRTQRLDDLLRSTKKVLMIRLEEYMGDRILDTEHEHKYHIKTELEYLQDLQDYLCHIYPTTEVYMIFITTLVDQPRYDYDRRMVCLPMAKDRKFDWNDADALPELFDRHGNFLKRCFGEPDGGHGRPVLVRRVRRQT